MSLLERRGGGKDRLTERHEKIHLTLQYLSLPDFVFSLFSSTSSHLARLQYCRLKQRCNSFWQQPTAHMSAGHGN